MSFVRVSLKGRRFKGSSVAQGKERYAEGVGYAEKVTRRRSKTGGRAELCLDGACRVWTYVSLGRI